MNVFQYWPVLAEGLKYTLAVTLVAFVIATVLAVPVTGLRVSRVRVLRFAGTSFVEVLRGVPPLTWLFLAYFGLPAAGWSIEPLTAGILVLGVVYSSYLVEVYRAGLRAVPDGQREAAHSLGLGRRVTYVRVIAPQALRTILPPAVAYLIALLKDSALVSTIGVLDVTAQALSIGQSSPNSLAVFVSAALLYLAFSVPIGALARQLDVRLRHGQKAWA